MKNHPNHLKELQFAKDEFGNRRMQTDPEYRAFVEAEIAKLHPGEDRKVIDPKVRQN